MADKDKVVIFNEHVNKRDLEIILEVNRKAVEIETAVADQNEEIINLLTHIKKQEEKIDKLEEKIDKLIIQGENTAKDLFKMQVLFITGLLSLVIQVIQIFLKKP